jgi:hypothetical protein
MATLPEPERPVGTIRIWATYPDRDVAGRVARALEEAGVGRDRISIADGAGTTEGPVARTREHREGSRIAVRLGIGAVVGASIGAVVGVVLGALTGSGSRALALFTIGVALFGAGAGAFVGGIASLRSAAPDHRPTGEETPGGAAVEIRFEAGIDRAVIDVLQRYRPTSLALTDETGRPMGPDEVRTTMRGAV